MGHSYGFNRQHIVFSTRERTPLLTDQLLDRALNYMAVVAREHRFTILASGGVKDHVHLLAALPPALSVAQAVSYLKANSSRWLRQQTRSFSWQEGYAAFSVSASQVPRTIRYIESQQEHHTRHTFDREYLALLRKHGIEFDARFVLG